MQVIIKGDASGKVVHKFFLAADNKEFNLLTYLRNMDFPIASSCNGEGVCAKCLVFIHGESFLSCQLNSKELHKALSTGNNLTIHIGYL